MVKKTISEALFERFCDQNGVHWWNIPVISVGSGKSPDYRIECGGNIVIAEVKEFALSPDDLARLERLRSLGTTGVFDPKLDERVRRKINHAMPQLRQTAKHTYPAIIVLYDDATLLPLEGLEIRLAMYGQDIVEIGVTGSPSNPIPFTRHRFGGGRKVDIRQNTTLSAVALLTEKPDGFQHLAFYHNKYAAIPFDPAWLRRPTVQHYRIGDLPQEGGLRGWERI
jgi:hypothetical protein